MKRLIGYTVFWVAVGMIFDLIVKSALISILIILVLLILGYNLFME
ncbi:MAG: hypothetical protein LIO76_04980 [Clostridiales bacterium]|nr:hypothetical protein [Clostridiales bacterium]